jgi:thiamine biosynthesis lipoprotein
MDHENDGLLIHVSRWAMACRFEVCFPAGRYEDGTRAALDALDVVESLEETLSYFRPTSEISRVNQMAAHRPVEVDADLFDLLSLAVNVCADTGGAYDVTSAPLWEVWGFARRAGRLPEEGQLAEALARVGSRFVELDAHRRTVRFQRPGVQINLGSVGKGRAVDACIERLRGLGMTDVLVHGGQSSIRASGSPGGAGWGIGICNPCRRGRRLGEVLLRDRALGTSSLQFQSFRHRGRRYGHILDPRSGWPAEGVLSATVLAPTAALADALSTAFFVLGPEPSLAYCRGHPEIGMILQCPGKERDIEVFRSGLDDATLTLLRPCG